MEINIKGFGFFNYKHIVFNVHSDFIITWLNCCKVLSVFYYSDTKDIVFFWLRVFGLNCFQVLFVITLLDRLFEVKIFNLFPSFTPFDNAMDGTLKYFSSSLCISAILLFRHFLVTEISHHSYSPRNRSPIFYLEQTSFFGFDNLLNSLSGSPICSFNILESASLTMSFLSSGELFPPTGFAFLSFFF